MDTTLLFILLVIILLVLASGGFFGYHHYLRISETTRPQSEYVVEKPTATMPGNEILHTENGQRYSVNPNQNLAANTTQVTPITPGTGRP